VADVQLTVKQAGGSRVLLADRRRGKMGFGYNLFPLATYMMYAAALIGWIALVAAAWRFVVAYEQIPEALRGIAQALRSQPPDQS